MKSDHKKTCYIVMCQQHKSEKPKKGLIPRVLTYICVSFRFLHQESQQSNVKLSTKEYEKWTLFEITNFILYLTTFGLIQQPLSRTSY